MIARSAFRRYQVGAPGKAAALSTARAHEQRQQRRTCRRKFQAAARAAGRADSKAYPVDQDPWPLGWCADLCTTCASALPSCALFFPIACVFAFASAFLEVSSSRRAHFAVFAVGTSSSSYWPTTSSRQSTGFARIPDDKFYVLSNLIKSAVLTAYTPQAAYMLYQSIASTSGRRRASARSACCTRSPTSSPSSSCSGWR